MFVTPFLGPLLVPLVPFAVALWIGGLVGRKGKARSGVGAGL